MKSKNIPQKHLFTHSDQKLFDLYQIYQAGSIWLEKGKGNHTGTFDLFIRELPPKRNFFLFGGLEEMITGILNWRYTNEEIKFLHENQIITKKFAKYLESFKFNGDIYAMPEGTPFFPNETVLRISGRLIDVNLLTMLLMNSLTSNTLFLSKFIRLILAAKGIPIFSSVIRSHSFESGMKAARAQYLTGVASISCPAFYAKYNIKMKKIPPLTTLYHAYIQSFSSEIESMQAGSDIFPNRVMPMIDTYSYEQGMSNIIKLAKNLRKKNMIIPTVIIDSGKLTNVAEYVRKELDKNGFEEIEITIASNIDEYKIKEILDSKTPVNSFIAVTEPVTSSDAPKLETVFKLAEVNDGKEIRPTIKLARGKVSLPGKKQVFRKKRKHFTRDIIGFENEKLGTPLLRPIIKNGRPVYDLPSLDKIKAYISSQIRKLPPRLLSIHKKEKYEVRISKQIKKTVRQIRKDYLQKT